MQNIGTHIRHQLTFLAGLGGILLGWNLIAPEEVAAVNEAGAKLIDPLMIIAGAVAAFVGRLAISWVTGVFRRGAGENGETDKSGPSGGMSALLLMTCAAGVLGGLPSCSTAEWPLSVGIEGDGYSANYSSKGGLAIRATVTDRRYSGNK
jgi:hypothetical protein